MWTPDGTAITYSKLGERQGIYMKACDGRGEAKRLVALDEFHWLIGWTRTRARSHMASWNATRRRPSSIMALTERCAAARRRTGADLGRTAVTRRPLADVLHAGEGNFQVYVTPFPRAARGG